MKVHSDDAAFAAYRSTRSVALRNDIVTQHGDLAEAIARRFVRRGEPFEDLVQVAQFGLIRSVERFDPAFGHSFVSFAIPTMVGEIKRHFRDRTWSMHVSRPMKDLLPRLRNTTAQLTVALGRSPSAAEIARSLQVSVETVLEAMEAAAAYRPTSLSAMPWLAERSPQSGRGLGEVDVGSLLDRLTVERLLEQLSAREREIVGLRIFEDLTQLEIAERLGISQMHVSRLLRAAFARIDAREYLAS